MEAYLSYKLTNELIMIKIKGHKYSFIAEAQDQKNAYAKLEKQFVPLLL